jgi:hypothetical protein
MNVHHRTLPGKRFGDRVLGILAPRARSSKQNGVTSAERGWSSDLRACGTGQGW